MNPPISLRTLIEKLERGCEAQRAYLNRTSGEFAVLDASQLDRRQPDQDPDGSNSNAAQILGSREWLPLPGPYEIDDFDIMVQFCYSVEDRAVRAELLHRVEGPGAFARFSNALSHHNLDQDWLAFKQSQYKRFAIEWLEWNSIPYQEDI